MAMLLVNAVYWTFMLQSILFPSLCLLRKYDFENSTQDPFQRNVHFLHSVYIYVFDFAILDTLCHIFKLNIKVYVHVLNRSLGQPKDTMDLV